FWVSICTAYSTGFVGCADNYYAFATTAGQEQLDAAFVINADDRSLNSIIKRLLMALQNLDAISFDFLEKNTHCSSLQNCLVKP
ncbi:hypothetical protein, partial [Prevotellamassilia timonensis]|uniref:hypothetical protein n=1 Tax=Prevotellamassilia timonensis TaxID=1852370 RepID=UPI003077237A